MFSDRTDRNDTILAEVESARRRFIDVHDRRATHTGDGEQIWEITSFDKTSIIGKGKV